MNQIHPEPLSGTLVDILEETAARYPEHGIFHVASGDTSEEFQSYPELLRNAKEMAQVLYRRGLRPRTPLILRWTLRARSLKSFGMPVQRRPASAARPHAHAQSGFDGGAEDFSRLGGNQRLPSWPIRPTSGPLPC